MGFILLLICVLVGHSLWSMFFRHDAYGLLIGNVARVAAPWDGVVTELHVRESEEFEQADLIAELDNLPLRHRLDRLGDELRMAQAELDAQISRLRWDAQEYVDLSTRVAAQHYEAQGVLAEQQALLERFKRERVRAEELTQRQAISAQERDAAVLSELGQHEKVIELQSSAALWKSRAELIQALRDQGGDQLAPQLTAIENLQKEIVRLRELLEQGHLKAPFDSVVVRRHKLTGERVEAQEPVVEMLQSGSLEVVLFLSQDDITRLRIGDEIHVAIEPNREKVPCKVVRIGQRLETAPAAIERFYWSNEPLLPVYLKPDVAYSQWMSLRLGSVVKW